MKHSSAAIKALAARKAGLTIQEAYRYIFKQPMPLHRQVLCRRVIFVRGYKQDRIAEVVYPSQSSLREQCYMAASESAQDAIAAYYAKAARSAVNY